MRRRSIERHGILLGIAIEAAERDFSVKQKGWQDGS